MGNGVTLVGQCVSHAWMDLRVDSELELVIQYIFCLPRRCPDAFISLT